VAANVEVAKKAVRIKVKKIFKILIIQMKSKYFDNML